MSTYLYALLIKHHACIGEPILEGHVEEEPQEEEAVEPSEDVLGRPLGIPMLYNCMNELCYLLHCYVMI